MKFKCDGCGVVFYSDEHLKLCGFCSSNLKDITPHQQRVVCRGQGVEVGLIYDIPACEHFVLNNAPGNRCLYYALPRRCLLARLPKYQPRGVS
jgi:hypothetical protein